MQSSNLSAYEQSTSSNHMGSVQKFCIYMTQTSGMLSTVGKCEQTRAHLYTKHVCKHVERCPKKQTVLPVIPVVRTTGGLIPIMKQCQLCCAVEPPISDTMGQIIIDRLLSKMYCHYNNIMGWCTRKCP